MENQNNNPEIPQDDSWLDDILGEQAPTQELGPDEQAIAEAGLVHPEELELESILKENLEEVPENGQETPVDPEATQLFNPVQPPLQSENAPQEEPEQETEEPEEEEAPTGKRRPRMKKGYGLLGIPHILATAVWLAIVLAIGLYLGRMVWLCAVDVLALGKTPEKVTVTVTEDDDITAIAEKLKDAGMIRYPGLFALFADLTGKGEDIDPGTFTFNSKIGVEEG